MNFDKFKTLLDDQMSWPDYYHFKFVIKTEQKDSLIEMLSETQIVEKHSKNGTYVSINCRKLVHSADDVVEVYRQASKIEGILSL